MSKVSVAADRPVYIPTIHIMADSNLYDQFRPRDRLGELCFHMAVTPSKIRPGCRAITDSGFLKLLILNIAAFGLRKPRKESSADSVASLQAAVRKLHQ